MLVAESEPKARMLLLIFMNITFSLLQSFISILARNQGERRRESDPFSVYFLNTAIGTKNSCDLVRCIVDNTMNFARQIVP